MKRLICLLVLLAILTLSAACAAGTGGDNSDTTAAENIETTIHAESESETEFKAFGTVEPRNLGGYTFKILYPQTGDGYKDFYAPELNGAILNDAIYKRNLMVEEKLGIKMEIKWQSHTQINEDIKNLVTSNSYEYDMFGGHRTSLALSYGGYLYDYYDMDQINLDGEWWDQNWISAMSLGNSLHTLVGDISVKMLLFNSALCFNKKLFDDNGLEYPYELVRNKKWTYDRLYSLIKDYSLDLNSDGKLTWDSDRFGLVGWGTEAGFSLFYGSGFTFVSKTADGSYEIDFNTERLTSIMDKVFDIWVSANSYFNNTGSTSEHHFPFTAFIEDRVLFCDLVLYKVSMFLLDMESDYGIVPQPMFDENQADYCSYTGYTIPLIMVPKNCTDPDRTGRIIEAYCTASYDEVTPDLFSIVTEVKNARDNESSEMIRIIIRTKLFDPAHWYNITGYGSLSRTIVASRTNNIASSLKTYDKAAQNSLESISNAFEDLKK